MVVTAYCIVIDFFREVVIRFSVVLLGSTAGRALEVNWARKLYNQTLLRNEATASLHNDVHTDQIEHSDRLGKRTGGRVHANIGSIP